MWLSFQIDIYLLFTFQIIEMFIDHKKTNERERKLSIRVNMSINIIKYAREGQVNRWICLNRPFFSFS